MTLRTATIVSATLLALYVGVVGWTFHVQSISWPGAGSWGLVVFVLLVPGIVFQVVNLVFTWRTRRRMPRRMLVRIATIPAGLVLAGVLARHSSETATNAFQQAYAPFVARVQANLAAPCEPVAPYFALPSVAAFNRRSGHERPPIRLHHDRQRFVVALAGASLDIDGVTVSYASDDRQWHTFHNDDQSAADAHAHLVEGLETCVLQPE